MPTFWVQHFDPGSNNERLLEELDFLEERREKEAIRMVSSKRKVEQYFNKQVRPWSFRVGDLVLKQTRVTTLEKGKLKP